VAAQEFLVMMYEIIFFGKNQKSKIILRLGGSISE
jgi:hypothetical protein